MTLPGSRETDRSSNKVDDASSNRSGLRAVPAVCDRPRERLQLEDPVASGALWAEIDRAIVDQAPYLWLANQIAVEFVSERVGNYQWSPQWNSLLNELWVR